MSNFELAIETILEHEGGFVDHKHDPGGATNFGISLRWLEQIDLAEADIDMDGDVDADDIKKMTRKQAIAFYKKHWWVKHKYDRITNNGVAIKVFDMAVNMGAKQAHKLVQRSMRAVGLEVEDDGILGPKSIEAINLATSQHLIPAIRCTQAGFYYALVMRNAALRKAKVKKANGKAYEDFSVFLKGWLRRAYS